jgi:hypothetical protein
MSNWTDWLEAAIKLVVGGLLVAALMRWLARGQTERPAFTAAGGVLRHGSTLLILGAACTLFFAGCAYLSYFSRTGGPKVAAFFTGFALLGFYLLIEYVVARYELRPDGLQYRDVLGGRGLARWEDIATVRYAEGMKWFVVRTADGRTIRLSVLLTGLPVFAEAVLGRVRAGVVAPETLDVLRETAAGNPPSAWS